MLAFPLIELETVGFIVSKYVRKIFIIDKYPSSGIFITAAEMDWEKKKRQWILNKHSEPKHSSLNFSPAYCLWKCHSIL